MTAYAGGPSACVVLSSSCITVELGLITESGVFVYVEFAWPVDSVLNSTMRRLVI